MSPGLGVHDALVRTLLDAIDGRHWSSLRAIVTEGVVYDRPGYPSIEGVTEFCRFYTEVRIIHSGTHQLEALLTTEEQGFCWGRFRGWTRSGAKIDEMFADWYQFSESRISKRRSFFYRAAI